MPPLISEASVSSGSLCLGGAFRAFMEEQVALDYSTLHEAVDGSRPAAVPISVPGTSAAVAVPQPEGKFGRGEPNLGYAASIPVAFAHASDFMCWGRAPKSRDSSADAEEEDLSTLLSNSSLCSSPLSSSPPGTWSLLEYARDHLERDRENDSLDGEPMARGRTTSAEADRMDKLALALAFSPSPVLFQR